MPLDPAQVTRYARQIIVPGIGTRGQQRLLEACVVVAGAARGVDQARLYLEAAGTRVVADPDDSRVAVVLLAGVEALDAVTRNTLVAAADARRIPVVWYRLDEGRLTSGVHPASPLPDLGEAAAEAAGAWLHDAAACDAAAVACALICELPVDTGLQEVELGA